MKKDIFAGIGFGLTSGVITTLGLLVGLNAATNSKLAVIGGIISIAVADSLSDSLGIHISSEAENTKSHDRIWVTTFSTFISKFFLGLSFLIPILLFGLNKGILIAVIYGLLILGIFSYYISKRNKTNPRKVIFEHVGIALIVLFLSYYLGKIIGSIF